jgi:hypothetical protein
LGATMTSRAAASHAEASLSSLSSDLLMRVSHWLSINELCVFDTAINQRQGQFRAKFLSGLRNDTFLYPGAGVDEKTSEWQERYVQWLSMRQVSVNSIALNGNTTPVVFFMYDTLNRVNLGLKSLTVDGEVAFPKDMAVRNTKTLHKLELINIGYYGTQQFKKFMSSVREWGGGGGSLHKLTVTDCNFGTEVVEFGDSLTHLYIDNCQSSRITTPGDSMGCMRWLWGILSKCKNLKVFELSSTMDEDAISDQDLCLLARFCPHLTRLLIDSPYDEFSESALMCVAMKCTKLQKLELFSERTFSDRTIEAIAANLVSLRSLHIWTLQLRNPHTLRRLTVGCPLLQSLYIKKGNVHVSEAELLYLVKHAKILQKLKIGNWGHLDFKERWEELQLDNSAPEELLELGMEDPDALLTSQRDRLQGIRAATEQPGEMDTVDKLHAASSNPRFRVECSGWEDDAW